MNNEQRIAKLEQQVQELLNWKAERMRQQISFPLDSTSRKIVQKDMFVFTGTYAEVPPLPTGAICTVNDFPIAVHVEDVGDYS